MQSFSRLALVLFLGTASGLGFAMAPEVSTVLSDSGRFFNLTITNPYDQDIVCNSFKVEVAAAQKGCENPQFLVKDSWGGLSIKAHGILVDTNFGPEVLTRIKKKNARFCSNPIFTFNCAPAKN